jgi:rhodanese-related sulfurtransferase
MERIFALLLLALACTASPTEIREISQDDLLAVPASTLILDVRTNDEFASGHIARAVNIPHDQLAARLSEVEAFRHERVVVYCERGGRAAKAASTLADAKFSKIHHLTGDMTAWREQDRPTETPVP